jgi:hypothetical protein
MLSIPWKNFQLIIHQLYLLRNNIRLYSLYRGIVTTASAIHYHLPRRHHLLLLLSFYFFKRFFKSSFWSGLSLIRPLIHLPSVVNFKFRAFSMKQTINLDSWCNWFLKNWLSSFDCFLLNINFHDLKISFCSNGVFYFTSFFSIKCTFVKWIATLLSAFKRWVLSITNLNSVPGELFYQT